MGSIRIDRLQEIIKQKVATVLFRDIQDPRIRMVTVTKAELSRDLSHVKVYWSTLEEGGARRSIERGLEDARGYVQREMATALHTRIIPHLVFVFDKSIEGTERVSRLLREARSEDERRARARGEAPDEEDPDAGDPEQG